MTHLRIVSINDVYSLENLPRLRTLVERHRLEDPAGAFLVVVAGDFLAPSMLSSLDAGRGMVDCLNLLGVTHAIFGNHEDDLPAGELVARVRELRAVVVDSNVRCVEPALPTYDVVELGAERRVRVGLVGVVMNDPGVYRGKPFGGCDVAPANETARTLAARLVRDERLTCVVPITHQWMADDRALAESGDADGAPFPLVIGGHDHEPFVELVGRTWIVKTGMDAHRAAIVDLRWSEGDWPDVAVTLASVADYPEDDEMRARVDRHMARVRELESAALAPLAPGQTLSSIGTRAKQTSIGTLFCSRLRDALGADGCVLNGGGIRGAREHSRSITYGAIKAELPFDNEIVVVRLPGRVLRDAVAASRARAPVESAAFLQIDDGMSVDERGVVLTRVRGAPLEEARVYRIALVRNLLTGLDEIEPLLSWVKDHPDVVPPPGCGREIKEVLVSAFARSLFDAMGGFEGVDANRDGTITEEEMSAAVARATAEPASPLTVGLVLGALDRDRDRVVTPDEAPGPTDATDA